ncbi:MAG: M16 family metallopeptidase, partial [Longimicrobiales bacterium]
MTHQAPLQPSSSNRQEERRVPASASSLVPLVVGLVVAPLFGVGVQPIVGSGLQAQAATRTSDPASSQVLEPVASVEGITEYRLENGLRVLLFPDPSQPTITVNVTYMVGSRHEGYGETGMAHLLEHLLFQGTPDHPDIDQELADRGARANGTTWFDRTNYYETFPASPENLEWALDLEADRMVNSFVSAEDLESEMTVVRNEMESGENSPSRILRERVLSTAYLWHNYGQSTIGARSDVENVPIERLQNFYRRYYQPDNAVLIVAGRFEPEPTLQLVRDRFGEIPRPERTGQMRIWPTYTTEPTQDGEREVTLRRAGDEQILLAHYHG